ncbi:MAG: putative O-glycosylation ligase, exosortase A system-associated, partial [Rubritepida sp.]|nr:putative O-glycosylation ligase, exosortase A system-associated [Rubritepida sp.]
MRDAAFLSVISVLLGLVLVQPFVGVLLWSWISFMNPHRLVYGIAGDFPWAMIVFVCTLIGCLVAGELRLPPMNITTILILLLMICLTLTSIAALGSPPQVWEKWEYVMKVLLGLLLTMSLLTTRRRIHALVWVIVISLGFYGVRGGIFTIMTGGNYRVWGPPQTVIGDNNHLAAALLVVLPLMNYLRMQSAHRAVRIGLSIAMGLTLLATVGSYSRGA